MESIAKHVGLLLLLLSAAGCVRSIPLEGKRCPCVDGSVCCESGLCAPNSAACTPASQPSGGKAPIHTSASGGFDPSFGGPVSGMWSSGGPMLIYRLSVVRRYGVPFAEASGMACDGEYVWLLGANKLAHVELKTVEIDQQFDVDLTGGIAVLDGKIYVAQAGSVNEIVHVDMGTGEILKRTHGPTFLGPTDLDVSGDNLVESTGTGDVFTVEPATGAVLGSFAAGRLGRNGGVAVRGEEAFVASLFGGLDVFRVATGEWLGHVTLSDLNELGQRDLGPMCFNGSKLLTLSELGITEYEIIPPQ